jgi:hypothetical protein
MLTCTYVSPFSPNQRLQDILLAALQISISHVLFSKPLTSLVMQYLLQYSLKQSLLLCRARTFVPVQAQVLFESLTAVVVVLNSYIIIVIYYYYCFIIIALLLLLYIKVRVKQQRLCYLFWNVFFIVRSELLQHV